VIGKIFSVFLNSHSESWKLAETYRLITNRLGLITVAIGCLAFLPVMYKTWVMLGIPLQGGPMEGLRWKMFAWIAITILLVPMAFYVGMILVYGFYGLLMFMLGRFSWRQAVDFGLRAKYPEHWYKSDP